MNGDAHWGGIQYTEKQFYGLIFDEMMRLVRCFSQVISADLHFMICCSSRCEDRRSSYC